MGSRSAGLKLDLAAMLARKDEVVKGLTDGVRFLFRKNKIEPSSARPGSARRPRCIVDMNESGERHARGRPHPAGDRVGAGRACHSCPSTARRSSTRPRRWLRQGPR